MPPNRHRQWTDIGVYPINLGAIHATMIKENALKLLSVEEEEEKFIRT